MLKLKKILIMFVLLLQGINIYSQQLEKADSLTSEIILKKNIKIHFYSYLGILTGTNNPDTLLQYPGQSYLGDHFIRQVVPALGSWALKPDYEVYSCDYPLPWEDYELYKLVIPDLSPRNDSIARYYIYRDKTFNSSSAKPWNIYSGIFWFAYNSKTGQLKSLSSQWTKAQKETEWSFFFRLKRKNPFFSDYYDIKDAQLPVLSPQTEEEITSMLHSELMKNIYSYRMLQTNVRDSLRDDTYNVFLKEDVELFPFIDSLLPDFDQNLKMHCRWIGREDSVHYYRFTYDGEDILYTKDNPVDFGYDDDFNVNVSTGWDRYLNTKLPGCYPSELRSKFYDRYVEQLKGKLLPRAQHYMVGYDKKRELVHFISGENIFLTRYAEQYFGRPGYNSQFDPRRNPRTKNDSIEASYLRRDYVRVRMLAYSDENLIEKVIREEGEDESYWYFTTKVAYPRVYKVVSDIMLSENALTDTHYIYVRMNVYCDIRIRMSKKNYEIVEIVECNNCWEGPYIPGTRFNY